jgi:hypothetical protein
MLNLLKNPVRVAGIMIAASALAAAQGGFAQPGTVNYVEGQVNLDGQSITAKKIGSTSVSPGHVLQTNDGKAEMLLTPGVFVRLGAHSAVKMISPSLSDTRVELVQGEAMVEVADIEKENHIEVTVGAAGTTLKARGIYEFTANPGLARVYQGKAVVDRGSRSNNIYKGDQIALGAANPKLKIGSFNVKNTESTDDLYAWSKLRADYTAQANMSAASTYADYGPGANAPGWYGSGWYWDAGFDEYAFLMADGFMWDPFGFGFFSPGYWGAYAPYMGYGGYGYGYGAGYGYGRGGYGYGRGGSTGRGGVPVASRSGAVTRGSAGGAITRGGFAGGAITRNSARGAMLGGGVRGGLGTMGGGGSGGMRAGGFGGMHGGGGFGGMHGGGGGGRR